MSRILCLFGIHAWCEIYRRLAWWDQWRDVFRIIDQCDRCGKQRQWYDTGE